MNPTEVRGGNDFVDFVSLRDPPTLQAKIPKTMKHLKAEKYLFFWQLIISTPQKMLVSI